MKFTSILNYTTSKSNHIINTFQSVFVFTFLTRRKTSPQLKSHIKTVNIVAAQLILSWSGCLKTICSWVKWQIITMPPLLLTQQWRSRNINFNCSGWLFATNYSSANMSAVLCIVSLGANRNTYIYQVKFEARSKNSHKMQLNLIGAKLIDQKQRHSQLSRMWNCQLKCGFPGASASFLVRRALNSQDLTDCS